MLRRPRPGGGRHPPPLAPTVSNFKPRAQWSTLESSMFLTVNLPGFYMDQIKITKDERARTIHIEGQRPLSTQTKARFNEFFRVPESCDMTESKTSFSHGLLTIEFPVVVESEKTGKVAPHDKENRGTGLVGRTMRRSNLSDKEKQVGTSQEKAAAPRENKEEPKTYKSVVEGKREVPTANRVKTEQKVKDGEASSSLVRKEHTKQEKVVDKKDGSQLGQHKTVQKVKEEEARRTPIVGGSLKAKVPAQEEKVIERKKYGDIGQKKTGQKGKEEGITKTPTIGGSLEPKVHAKGIIGQKLKEEGKINLGQKKQEEDTKPDVSDKTRRTEKEIDGWNQVAPELKTKERVGGVGERKGDGQIVQKPKEEEKIGLGKKKEEKHTKLAVGDEARRSEKENSANEANPELKTKERVVGEKKVKEAGLVKETRDLKDNPEVVEPTKVDSGDPMKKESTKGREDREKIAEKSSESETGPLLVEGQKQTNTDPPAAEGSGLEKEESHKYDLSLVNVGVASLVIMGFGAYVFVPLVKMFY